MGNRHRLGSVGLRAMATGAAAVGALAIGSVAIGALAVGAMALGKLTVGRARIGRLEIDDLVVRRGLDAAYGSGPPGRAVEAWTPNAESLLYLEDLSLGRKFESATLAVDAEEIKAFAGSFDPQPFHLREDGSAAATFGGLVASGWHTAALTMRLLVTGGLPLAGGMVGAGAELNWPRPVRPGDVLRVESEVVAIVPSRSKPGRAIVSVRSTTLNQANQPVQVLTAKLVVHRRPGASEGEAGPD